MDLRHGRPLHSQGIIFESGHGITSINSTITDDSGNFRVSGLRVAMKECYYNHRALYGGRSRYNQSQLVWLLWELCIDVLYKDPEYLMVVIIMSNLF